MRGELSNCGARHCCRKYRKQRCAGVGAYTERIPPLFTVVVLSSKLATHHPVKAGRTYNLPRVQRVSPRRNHRRLLLKTSRSRRIRRRPQPHPLRLHVKIQAALSQASTSSSAAQTDHHPPVGTDGFDNLRHRNWPVGSVGNARFTRVTEAIDGFRVRHETFALPNVVNDWFFNHFSVNITSRITLSLRRLLPMGIVHPRMAFGSRLRRNDTMTLRSGALTANWMHDGRFHRESPFFSSF